MINSHANREEKDILIRRRVFINTVSNYVVKITVLGMGFFLTPFILKQLGVTTYALWVLVDSIMAYAWLLDFGVANAVTKYVSEFRAKGQVEQAQQLIATTVCLYSILGLVAIGLSAAIAPLFPDLFKVPPEQRATAMQLVLLSGLGLGLAIPCGTTSAILQGLQRFDLTSLLNIISTLLSMVATVIVLLLGGGVLGIVAVGIVVMVIMQVPSIWLIHRVAPELHFRWKAVNRQLARKVTSFSSSLFVIQAAGRLETKTDEIVIGIFLPIRAVTPYAIAQRLSEVPQTLTSQFIKVLLPLASELHAENDQTRLHALYIASTRVTLAIFLPIACILVILARPIITVWVGTAYVDYAHLILILTLASMIDTSQWPAGYVLQGMARHRPLAMMSVYAGLSNLILSITLVQLFGLTGVALGTLIPTSVICIGFVLPYTMRVLHVSIAEFLKEIFLPVLLPTLVMALVLYILQRVIEPSSLLSIIIIAGFSLMTYLIGYFSIGASGGERQAYLEIMKRTVSIAKTRFNHS